MHSSTIWFWILSLADYYICTGAVQEFAIAFAKPGVPGYINPRASILLASLAGAKVSIIYSLEGESEELVIEPGSTHDLSLPSSIFLDHANKQQNKTVLISTTGNISVIGFVREPWKNPLAFSVAPINSVDTKFLAMTYDPTVIYRDKNAFIYVISTTDGTVVSFTVNTMGIRRRRMDTTVTLNKGKVFVYAKPRDLTGTVIESNHPIAVYAGSECSEVPVYVKGQSGMLLQQMPNHDLGTNFILGTATPSLSPMMVRIIGNGHMTDVFLDGEKKGRICAGQILEFELESKRNGGSHLLNATDTILVALLKQSETYGFASPAMIIVPPVNRMSTSHTVVIPRTMKDFDKNTITVYGSSASAMQDISHITVNSKVVKSSISGEIMKGYSKAVYTLTSDGIHNIESTDNVWLIHSGFSDGRFYFTNPSPMP